jgi:hypothetical protein
MTPWRLVTLVDADAVDMTGTKEMLARRANQVNDRARAARSHRLRVMKAIAFSAACSRHELLLFAER